MEQKNVSTNPVIFILTIPWADVEKAYNSQLDKIVESANLKGFRPGKAPRAMVEEHIGKKAIFSDVIEAVLPLEYQKEVTTRALQPLIAPRVKAITLEEKKDWVFEIAIVIKPDVKLEGYEVKVKQAITELKPVTEGKEVTQDQKMKVAFDTLLSLVQVDLPQMLVDEEVNTRLSQLLDQVQALGMTIDQYMKAKNLDAAKLRESYEKTARDMFKLNFALDVVATDQKFTEKDRIAKAVNWLVSL